MLEGLQHIDNAILFAINGMHTPLLDWLMWELSGKFVAAVVYIALAYLIYKKFAKKALYPLLIAASLFVITDQTSSIVKETMRRERPSHNPEIAGKLVYVDGYQGGQYGFFSSHAANSFCICTFCFLIMRRRLKGMGWLFVFAALHAISRVYLGVHYPSDILVGAVYGTLWGYIGYLTIKRYVQFIPTRAQGSGYRGQ